MSIHFEFSQALRGRITVFLLKVFKGERLSDDWGDRITAINNIIATATSVIELKISVQDYLKAINKSFWMFVPGSALRIYYHSLKEVVDSDEFSDRSLLKALAKEEEGAVNAQVIKIKKEFKQAVRTVNRECRSLKKNLLEQQEEVKRLSIENQLLLAALVKMNQERSETRKQNNSAGDLLISEELAEIKAQNRALLEQNERLLKTISALVQRPIHDVQSIIQNIQDQDHPVDSIVKKLQYLSSHRSSVMGSAFFKPLEEGHGQLVCHM